MDISCYLVSNGEFKSAIIPEKLLVELSKNLRTKGIETVHFADKSIDVEGLYIPAKGVEGIIMIANNSKEGEKG